MPETEALAALARHRASLCLFLSVQMIKEVASALMVGYGPDTPVAVAEKVTWPEERIIHCRLNELVSTVEAAGIERTALVLVGDFLTARGEPSRLYDPSFSRGYR